MFRRVIDSSETASRTLGRATPADRVPVFGQPFERNVDDGFFGAKIEDEKHGMVWIRPDGRLLDASVYASRSWATHAGPEVRARDVIKPAFTPAREKHAF